MTTVTAVKLGRTSFGVIINSKTAKVEAYYDTTEVVVEFGQDQFRRTEGFDIPSEAIISNRYDGCWTSPAISGKMAGNEKDGYTFTY